MFCCNDCCVGYLFVHKPVPIYYICVHAVKQLSLTGVRNLQPWLQVADFTVCGFCFGAAVLKQHSEGNNKPFSAVDHLSNG